MSDNKVALITGCSSGFGLLATVELARRGVRVIPTMRNPGKRGALDDAVKAAGVSVEPLVQLDVTDAESIARAASEVREKYGRLDILVNNAGYGLAGAVEEVPVEEFRRQLETNLIGVAEVTKAFLPLMRERRAGRIVNVSSMGGRMTFPFLACYHASKWGLEGMSEAWDYELRPFGIQVAIVEPGATQTEFDRGSLVKILDEQGPYYPFASRMLEMQEKYGGMQSKPDPVARTIAKASLARRPKLRYIVGADARLGWFFRRITPFAILQALIARMFGLRRAAA